MDSQLRNKIEDIERNLHRALRVAEERDMQRKCDKASPSEVICTQGEVRYWLGILGHVLNNQSQH